MYFRAFTAFFLFHLHFLEKTGCPNAVSLSKQVEGIQQETFQDGGKTCFFEVMSEGKFPLAPWKREWPSVKDMTLPRWLCDQPERSNAAWWGQERSRGKRLIYLLWIWIFRRRYFQCPDYQNACGKNGRSSCTRKQAVAPTIPSAAAVWTTASRAFGRRCWSVPDTYPSTLPTTLKKANAKGANNAPFSIPNKRCVFWG